MDWSESKVLEWCFNNGKHNRKKMVVFLSLNRRLTRAMRALSTYFGFKEAQNQLLLAHSMRFHEI